MPIAHTLCSAPPPRRPWTRDWPLATTPQSLITVLGNEIKYNAKRFEVPFDFEVSGGPGFEKERQHCRISTVDPEK